MMETALPPTGCGKNLEVLPKLLISLTTINRWLVTINCWQCCHTMFEDTAKLVVRSLAIQKITSKVTVFYIIVFKTLTLPSSFPLLFFGVFLAPLYETFNNRTLPTVKLAISSEKRAAKNTKPWINVSRVLHNLLGLSVRFLTSEA